MSETLTRLTKLAAVSQSLRKVAFEKKALVGAALRGAGAVVGTAGSLALQHPIKTMAAVSTAGAAKNDFKKNMAAFKTPGAQ